MHLHGTETARIPELVFSLKHNLHDVIELLKINVLSTAVLSANTIPPTIAHFLVKKNHLSIVNQLSSKHTLRSGSQNHTHLLFTSIQSPWEGHSSKCNRSNAKMDIIRQPQPQSFALVPLLIDNLLVFILKTVCLAI